MKPLIVSDNLKNLIRTIFMLKTPLMPGVFGAKISACRLELSSVKGSCFIVATHPSITMHSNHERTIT